jgi:hypothetical protein
VPGHLVNTGGAVKLGGFTIKRQIARHRRRRIGQTQMDRLILLVVRVRNEDRGQAVEADHAIGRGIGDRPRILLAPQLAVALMPHRIGQADPQVRIHISAPASKVPSTAPNLAISGWTLRTMASSLAIQLERSAVS